MEKRDRYIRRPEHDRRFSRGDDWAGDAWLDTTTGKIVYSIVNYDMNAKAEEVQQ